MVGKVKSAKLVDYVTPKVGTQVLIQSEDKRWFITKISQIYNDNIYPYKLTYKGSTFHRKIDELYCVVIEWHDTDSWVAAGNKSWGDFYVNFRLNDDEWHYVKNQINMEGVVSIKLEDKKAFLIEGAKEYSFTLDDIEEIVKDALSCSDGFNIKQFMEKVKKEYTVTL